MTNKEKKQMVIDTLEYMISEGMVVKLSDGRYRLKSERELEKEMEALLNEQIFQTSNLVRYYFSYRSVLVCRAKESSYVDCLRKQFLI